MEGRLPFKTTWAFSIPVWSADGKSFAIVATSPIGSEWEQADARDHRDESGAARLRHLVTGENRLTRIESVRPVGFYCRSSLKKAEMSAARSFGAARRGLFERA